MALFAASGSASKNTDQISTQYTRSCVRRNTMPYPYLKKTTGFQNCRCRSIVHLSILEDPRHSGWIAKNIFLVTMFSKTLVLWSSYFISCTLAIPGAVDIGQSAADRARYPEVKGCFRIEALILTMANPRGTTRNWMPCDLVPGKCNPKITAAID